MAGYLPQSRNSNDIIDVYNAAFICHIIAKFKARLKDSGDSITKVAHQLSINRSTLSMIVNNRYDPSIEMLIAMSRYLNRSFIDLAMEFRKGECK